MVDKNDKKEYTGANRKEATMASNRVFAAMPQLDVDLYTIIDRTYIRLENRHPILTGVLIIMVGTTVNTILDTRRAIAALFA